MTSIGGLTSQAYSLSKSIRNDSNIQKIAADNGMPFGSGNVSSTMQMIQHVMKRAKTIQESKYQDKQDNGTGTGQQDASSQMMSMMTQFMSTMMEMLTRMTTMMGGGENTFNSLPQRSNSFFDAVLNSDRYQNTLDDFAELLAMSREADERQANPLNRLFGGLLGGPNNNFDIFSGFADLAPYGGDISTALGNGYGNDYGNDYGYDSPSSYHGGMPYPMPMPSHVRVPVPVFMPVPVPMPMPMNQSYGYPPMPSMPSYPPIPSYGNIPEGLLDPTSLSFSDFVTGNAATGTTSNNDTELQEIVLENADITAA